MYKEIERPYPIIELSPKELGNFVEALHNDRSSDFMCQKLTLSPLIREKLYKIFGRPSEMDWSVSLEGYMREKIGAELFGIKYSHFTLYQQRCEWMTLLLGHNKAPKYLKASHKNYQKARWPSEGG